MTNEEVIKVLEEQKYPYPEYYKDAEINEAINIAIKALNNERPQGEWIIVKDEKYGDNVRCPFCGKELAGTDLNFCCKCGAKLIGSEKMNGGAK